MRRWLLTRGLNPLGGVAALMAVALTGCGGGTKLITGSGPILGVQSKTPNAGQRLGFPSVATKNTTRVGGADPVADAAGVALAVYPSVGSGTHPPAVVLAPTDDWQASLAASALMAAPLRAPILLSGRQSLPSATADALALLSPTGSGAAGGAQIIRVGDVPTPAGLRDARITGADPYALAGAVDRFFTAARGRPSVNVIIASGEDPAFAMPAAGLAAESGDPILFVTHGAVPPATRQAIQAHGHPNIYVLGPTSTVPDSVLHQLAVLGRVKRISGSDPASNSVQFAIYRDPACPGGGQPCGHVPGSFGWAMRSPGHGYVLLNAARPLDAAASAALSSTGSYGPQLLVSDPSTLPQSVLDFLLSYATPGYTQQGPTAAVYNHGWVIGDPTAISTAVQGQLDGLLEVQPVK